MMPWARYGELFPSLGMDVDEQGRITAIGWSHGATPDADLERRLGESVKSLSAENRMLRARIVELETELAGLRAERRAER